MNGVVAVTGAGGFLGVNVIDALLARGHEVVAIDRRPVEARSEQLSCVVADVTDPIGLVRVLTQYRVTDLVHLAAATPRPGDNRPEAVMVNVAGTQNVLNAAGRSHLRRCVVASSSAVFGDRVYQANPLTESDLPAPTSLYGITKVAAEQLVALAEHERPGRHVVVRVPALFGPGETETPDRSLMSPPLQLLRALESGLSVAIAAGGARDWTYAPNVADVIARILEMPLLSHPCYHLGCGTTWHLGLLAESAATAYPNTQIAVSDPDVTIDYGDDLGRNRTFLDNALVSSELRLDPRDLFAPPEEACSAFLNWWVTTANQRKPYQLHSRNPITSHLAGVKDV